MTAVLYILGAVAVWGVFALVVCAAFAGLVHADDCPHCTGDDPPETEKR